MQVRRAGSSLQALLMLLALSAASVGGLFGQTHALALEQRAMEQQPLFTSVGATDLMAVGATSIALTAAGTDAGLHQAVTTVVNLSGRSLPVSVGLEGLSGVDASVEPGILGPGETATVRLDGPVPTTSGHYTGILHLYGFNQYVEFAIPVALDVTTCRGTPPPVAEGTPPEGAAVEGTAPEGCTEALSTASGAPGAAVTGGSGTAATDPGASGEAVTTDAGTPAESPASDSSTPAESPASDSSTPAESPASDSSTPTEAITTDTSTPIVTPATVPDAPIEAITTDTSAPAETPTTEPSTPTGAITTDTNTPTTAGAPASTAPVPAAPTATPDLTAPATAPASTT